MVKKVYQLITRDGIKSDFEDLLEMRDRIYTVCGPELSCGFLSAEAALIPENPANTRREYRFRRVRTIEVYEYEEV